MEDTTVPNYYILRDWKNVQLLFTWLHQKIPTHSSTRVSVTLIPRARVLV